MMDRPPHFDHSTPGRAGARPSPRPDEPLRVVLVVPGGVSRDEPRHVIPSIAWLVERLAERHRLIVLALYGGGKDPYPWRGAVVHTLGARHKGEYALPGPRFAPPGLGLARSTLRARAIVAGAGGADVVHGFWGTASGLLAALLGRTLGAPTAVSLNGGELVGLRDVGYGAQLRRRERLQVAMAMRLADRVTAPTHFMGDLARERGVEVEIIPFGVDARALAGADATVSTRERDDATISTSAAANPSIATAAGSDPSTPTPAVGPPWRLLFAGNLNRVKDPFTLLEAVARLRADGVDVQLDVAGADHLGGAVARRAEALGLELAIETGQGSGSGSVGNESGSVRSGSGMASIGNEAVASGSGSVGSGSGAVGSGSGADRIETGWHVRFHGLIDQRALAALYRGSHLLVIPSRHEAGPVVALEAACLGLPIVGSAVGHVADWAPAAATAVPPGDPAALARAIAGLIDDPARRASTATAAREWAMRHDADWTAAAFERVYRELVAGRAAVE